MIINLKNPSKMDPHARLTEIAAIMAKGYIRLKNSQKALDVSLQDCAPCDTTVNSNVAEPSLEVA